jgi:hypothetical protein
MKNPMIFLRTIATVAVVGMTFSSTVNAALATELIAQSDKVTICQRTGSAKNPYVEITISRNALPAHEKKGDFLATPGCQPPAGTPQPPNPPSASVDCVITGSATQTANTVTGTSGDDTIDCTNASPGKTITGGDGNDTITGTAFNDAIDAGNGNDTVTGGPGDDVIEGGDGNDTLTGSAGNNTVTDIGDGEDTITP